MLVKPDIPNLLKLRRKIIGRKQMDIARSIGYKNKSFISLIENGEVQIPLQKIGDIARAYQFRYPGDFMKLAACYSHPENFEIFKSLLVYGYGFSEDYIQADLDRARTSLMIDCGFDPREGNFVDAPRKIMLALGELHKLGYERLRLTAEIDPTGMFWRWAIVPVNTVPGENGIRIPETAGACPHGSLYDGRLSVGMGDQPDDSPQSVARLIIRKYPVVETDGRGKDPEYVRWFRMVIEKTDPIGYIFATDERQSGGIAVLRTPEPVEIDPPPVADGK